MKKIYLIFLLLFLLSAIIFLAHYWVVGSGVWGDGLFYYSYLNSLVADVDLNFSNEYQYFSGPRMLTKTGLVVNKFSIGPALLWLPFFILARFVGPPDGFSRIYQVFTGLGAVFYGALGLWFCLVVAKKYFSEKIALTATLGVWLASNLFFYLPVDPINSHAVSFFISSLVLLYLQKYFKKRKFSFVFILGILMGILCMIRVQDLIFSGPIIILLVSELKNKGKNYLATVYKICLFLMAHFIGFLPQLIVWKVLYGEIKSPYLIHGENFNWLKPQILPVLVGEHNGLLFYSPILIFSLIGFFFFFKKEKLLAFVGFSLFLLQTYVVACWHNWWGGAAYGGRMFISLMPFFIIGLGMFLEQYKKRWKFLNLIILFLGVFNFSSIIWFLLINP